MIIPQTRESKKKCNLEWCFVDGGGYFCEIDEKFFCQQRKKNCCGRRNVGTDCVGTYRGCDIGDNRQKERKGRRGWVGGVSLCNYNVDLVFWVIYERGEIFLLALSKLSQALTDSHKLSQALTGSHKVSQSLTDSHKLSQALTSSHRLSQGLTGSHSSH